MDRECRHERGGQDGDSAPEEDGAAQRRITGDVIDPFADLRQQALARAIDRGTQVAPHEQQADGGERERNGIDGERRARPDGRGQHPRDRRTDDEADRVDRLEVRIRTADLAPPDDGRHGCRVAGQEERPEDAEGSRHQEDDDHRRSTKGDRDRDECREDGSPEVGQEHHPLAVAAVGECAGDHPEDEIGQRLDGTDDAHGETRPGQRKDEERQGREADGVAQGRDALRGQEDLEVAVLGERFDAAVTRARWRRRSGGAAAGASAGISSAASLGIGSVVTGGWYGTHDAPAQP